MEAGVNIAGTKMGDFDNTITHSPYFINVWGFRIPLINNYGSPYGDEWYLFPRPLVVERSVLEKYFHQECLEYRLFFQSMEEEAKSKANESNDVWHQFYWDFCDTPANIEELWDIYWDRLPSSIKRDAYSIDEEDL